MDEIIHSEAFLIVISGVAIFALQQIMVEWWIRPVTEYKKILQRIDCFLFENDRLIKKCLYGDGSRPNINEDLIKAAKELSKFAADLTSTFQTIPYLERFWLDKIRGYKVISARTNLIWLSNFIGYNDQSEQIALAMSKIKLELKFFYTQND